MRVAPDCYLQFPEATRTSVCSYKLSLVLFGFRRTCIIGAMLHGHEQPFHREYLPKPQQEAKGLVQLPQPKLNLNQNQGINFTELREELITSVAS